MINIIIEIIIIASIAVTTVTVFLSLLLLLLLVVVLSSLFLLALYKRAQLIFDLLKNIIYSFNHIMISSSFLSDQFFVRSLATEVL